MEPFGALLLALMFLGGNAKHPKKRAASRAPSSPRKRAVPTRKRARRVTRKKATKIVPGDVSFPGPNWIPYSPPPKLVIESAKQLIPVLHDGWDPEDPPKKAILYHKELKRPVAYLGTMHENGKKKAVTAWRLKEGVLLPKGWVEELAKGDGQQPSPKRPTVSLRPKKKAVAVKPKKKVAKPKAKAPVVKVKRVKPKPYKPPSKRGEKKRIRQAPKTPLIGPTKEYLAPEFPLLQQGNRGKKVEKLQRMLGIGGKLGFFGSMTRERVTAFQRAKGLKVDGLVGPKTWKALHEQ